MYKNIMKPVIDRFLALLFVLLFWWLYTILAIVVRINLGSPILFVQERPGKIDPKTGEEVMFKLYKFRTMTSEKDADGNLLPDEQRLTKFGKFLRSTSCDELPSVIMNILLAKPGKSMSLVGPRPQLVRDMVFMSKEQRNRHTVAPGLTGLAQINGRNSITWEEKFDWDLKYVEHISFWKDIKIFVMTFYKVVVGRKVYAHETDLNLDYGDVLLRSGKISKEKYDELQKKAKELLNEG